MQELNPRAKTRAGDKKLLSQSGTWTEARRTPEEGRYNLAFIFLFRSSGRALTIWIFLSLKKNKKTFAFNQQSSYFFVFFLFL